MGITKKLFASFISFVLALTMCVGLSTVAFADNEPADAQAVEEATDSDLAIVDEGVEEVAGGEVEELVLEEQAADCTATIKYYEYADYENPMNPIDEKGRIFIGERTIEGLYEGEVLDAWNYVVDIPGHFFFDGWPATLTVSKDPSQNVFEFYYFKKWEYEYTVNYYLMVGADLTADSWAGALAPQGVEFIKLGSETFTDQRINKLVKGDAYAYKLDGMYCIDTYPSEIRVGLDSDNNVINVLYTPDSVNLPDSVEIPDDIAADTPSEGIPGDDDAGDLGPAGGEDEGTNEGDDASGDAADNDGVAVTLPDDLEVIENELEQDMEDSASSQLPPDQTLDKDEFTELLPDNVKDPTDDESKEIHDDFLGDGPSGEQITITDEMLQNPLSKEEAQQISNAYRAGYESGNLANMGNKMGVWLYVALAAGGIAILILIGQGVARLMKRRKNKA